MGLILQQASPDQDFMTKAQEPGRESKSMQGPMKSRLRTVTSPLPLHSTEPSMSQESPDLRKELQSQITRDKDSEI